MMCIDHPAFQALTVQSSKPSEQSAESAFSTRDNIAAPASMAWRIVGPTILCVLLCTTASAHGDKPEWKYCHKEKTPVQLAKFSFTPESPSPGDLVAFNITGKAGKEIPEGTVGISVELGKIPIYSTSGNLCVSTHCPVPKGAFSVAFEQLLPRLTPPGRYTVKMIFSEKANSLAGPPLLCIEVAFTVKSPKRS